jgi:hypothetical protein
MLVQCPMSAQEKGGFRSMSEPPSTLMLRCLFFD